MGIRKGSNFVKKSHKMAHSRTAVPVPVSVVPVPKRYCWVLLGWYLYQQVWYRYHLATATFSCLFFSYIYIYIYIELSRMLYILGCTGRSLLSLLHTPSNPDLCSRNCVLHSLDTFTLTLGSTVLQVKSRFLRFELNCNSMLKMGAKG